MDMASFIALLFAKNMALLPLGEPKIGTENDLAPRARKKDYNLMLTLQAEYESVLVVKQIVKNSLSRQSSFF